MKSDDLQLWQPEAFDQRFTEYMNKSKNQREAYLKVEADHKRTFGKPHYSNLESYLHARNKRLRKKCNHVT